MSERSLSFGAVAARYERFRLGYPDELVDAVLAYAGRPVRTALEIGAGTGKATRAFAARGIAVTATDPDEAMLAELRAHVPTSVVTVRASFEQLSLSTAFDLVFAAASLHWTTPEQRWPRIAALLVAGGVFASFGGPLDLVDKDLEHRLVQAQSEFMDRADIPSPDGTPPESAMQWPGTELVASDLFTDIEQIHFDRWVTMTAADYLAHRSTVSAYLVLPDAVRAAVFDRLGDLLPADVEVTAGLTLHLARKA